MSNRLTINMPPSSRQKRTMYLVAGFALALMLIALSASVWSGNSSLRGTVYLDANHNGMRDAGEAGVPNVYVRVAVFSDAWSQEFYTGDDGTYAPVAMSAGDYYVRLIVPDCYQPTTPIQHGVWLMDDQVILGLDFGIAPLPHCGKPMPMWGGDMSKQGGMGMGGAMAETYTVQAGDTLDSIAEMHRVSIASLMELNGLSSPDDIYVGLVLQIPGPGMMGNSQNAQETDQAAAPPAETEQAAAPPAEAQQAAAPPAETQQAAAPPAETQQVAAPPAEAPQSAVKEAPSTMTTAQTVYVVQPGDYLGKIAQEYGTTVAAIAAANNIANVNLLYVGQQLVIP
ncbi:MAG: LysM peptidoglycan-binding domain-containing protein [Anaerolineae bacterium]|nr:LysM peptidoglycan-binding domain-containing protein [Anaerolineae bacterium]MCO5203830.1 LysM peptidoglycan-binding domain-containing protein [Anaerolineae bacterium]